MFSAWIKRGSILIFWEKQTCMSNRRNWLNSTASIKRAYTNLPIKLDEGEVPAVLIIQPFEPNAVATCWAAQTKLRWLHVARGCSHFYKKSQLSIAFSCLRMAPWSVSYPQHPSCTCMAGYTPGICFCRHKVISTGSSMKIRSKNAKDLKLSWCLCERYVLVFVIHTLSKYAATACILYQRFYITLFACPVCDVVANKKKIVQPCANIEEFMYYFASSLHHLYDLVFYYLRQFLWNSFIRN